MSERVVERFVKEAEASPDIKKFVPAKVQQLLREVADIGAKASAGDTLRALHALARSLPLMQYIAEDLGAEEAAKLIPKAQWAIYRAIKPLHEKATEPTL
jgi:hypothetical protein